MLFQDIKNRGLRKLTIRLIDGSMSNVPDLTAVILGLILAAWLGAAAWAIWTGLAENWKRRSE